MAAVKDIAQRCSHALDDGNLSAVHGSVTAPPRGTDKKVGIPFLAGAAQVIREESRRGRGIRADEDSIRRRGFAFGLDVLDE